MEKEELRVLTLNCWGLPDAVTKLVYRRYNDPKISKGRKWTTRTQRIEAIAKTLHAYDVVCLQEVWIQKDQEAFSAICAENGLPFSHVFSSGMIGSSGLQIISRYPIKDVYFHRYRVNGRIIRFDHGDYHAGKGFGFARIAVSETQTVGIIITHTIASYDRQDSYLPDRLSQVWEISRFIQFATHPDQLLMVVGDMNFRTETVEYNMITQVGKLSDAYLVANGTKKGGSTIMADLASDEKPTRIDYVFFTRTKQWELESSTVVLNSEQFLYSDHFGVTATFRSGNSIKNSEKDTSTNVSTHNGSDDGIEAEPPTITVKSALEQAGALIKTGTVSAQQRKTNHLIRCLLSLLMLYILNSFSAPAYIVAITAVVMVVEFFIAMFVVENEISALKEAHKEMKYFC